MSLLLEIVTARITAWVARMEERILREGQELPLTSLNDAVSLGIANYDKIRVLFVDKIPMPPLCGILRAVINAEIPIDTTAGIAYGYGIMVVKRRQNDRQLLLHELIHVRQLEKAGSLRDFISAYLIGCFKHGYRNSPFEVEAYSLSETICNSRLV